MQEIRRIAAGPGEKPVDEGVLVLSREERVHTSLLADRARGPTRVTRRTERSRAVRGVEHDLIPEARDPV